jgi:uracil-DNA glycosylase
MAGRKPANGGRTQNRRSYLERELDLLKGERAILALGGYAYRHVLRIYRGRDDDVPFPVPDLEHKSSFSIGENAPHARSFQFPKIRTPIRLG